MEQKVVEKVVQTATQSACHVSDENIAYLMGLSFIIGSLFTIFTLILLDFMKRDRVEQEVD